MFVGVTQMIYSFKYSVRLICQTIHKFRRMSEYTSAALKNMAEKLYIHSMNLKYVF